MSSGATIVPGSYKEVQMNLFSAPKEYALVHCISADCALGAGIAKEFTKRYPALRGHCRTSRPAVTQVITYHGERLVYNMVTKMLYWHKPTFDNLAKTLWNLCHEAKAQGVAYVAMPKIGCGLDQLDWNEVRGLIQKILGDFDILVCYL